MNIGMHLATWAIALVALIMGWFLIARSSRNKKWNWAAAGVLALILAVGMFVSGWSQWPKQTAEHFISEVYQGHYDEAKECLREPQQLKVSDDGTVDILAEDGSNATVGPEELPLMAGGRKRVVSMRSLGAFLAAKHEFFITTGKKGSCSVHCTAERGQVRIRHVEITQEDGERAANNVPTLR